MARVNIYLTDNTHQKLLHYIRKRYGKHHIKSAIVQEAIEQYLRENDKEERGNKN